MNVWDRLRADGRLTPAICTRLRHIYGERGEKALRAVKERRVKRYLDFFVVVGLSSEYVIEDDFCTCGDFLFRGRECSHIIAVRIAQATGIYETYSSWYLDEWEEDRI
ncbi:MAG: SWIM zinc finger family protein [Methanomicrobiaceae archaeon]|nr:SWIM zinc finger family protein [Methanomicrobiaceae archaeon]